MNSISLPQPLKDPNDKWWIILPVVVIGAVFILPFLLSAVVFGMAGSTAGNAMAEKVIHTKIVTAAVQQPDANTIIVTYLGGTDAGSLIGITIMVTDSGGQSETKVLGSKTGSSQLNAGEKISFAGAFSGQDHVIATGWFSDGSEQVILDNNL